MKNDWSVIGGTYYSWYGMIDRCTNPLNSRYKDYGGRGISVCDRWKVFNNFLGDMGIKPKGMSIDRINNDGNYAPNNCKWSTGKEQCRNRRTCRLITIDGITRTLTEWCEQFNTNRKNALRRILYHGWEPEKAVTTPTLSFSECGKLGAGIPKTKRITI